MLLCLITVNQPTSREGKLACLRVMLADLMVLYSCAPSFFFKTNKRSNVNGSFHVFFVTRCWRGAENGCMKMKIKSENLFYFRFSSVGAMCGVFFRIPLAISPGLFLTCRKHKWTKKTAHSSFDSGRCNMRLLTAPQSQILTG